MKINSRKGYFGRGCPISWHFARRRIRKRFPNYSSDYEYELFLNQAYPGPHYCEICWELHRSFYRAGLCEEKCSEQFKFKKFQTVMVYGSKYLISKLFRRRPDCNDPTNYYECSQAVDEECGGEMVVTVSEDLLSFGKILS